MQCFSESLIDGRYWRCDQDGSYLESVTKGGAFKVVEMQPFYEAPRSVVSDPLARTFFMTVDFGVDPLPVAFGLRDFPVNASKELKEVYVQAQEQKDYRGKPTKRPFTWFTYEELHAKPAQLFMLNTRESLAAQDRLVRFINDYLPKPTQDLKHHRVLTWF